MIGRTMPKQKLLILGASSFVGRHLLARLNPANVIATYNNRPIPGGVRFDSVSMQLNEIVHDPALVSHAVLLLGDTQPDSCFTDRERSQQVNVDSLRRVVDKLAYWKIPILFTSSEFVFDGKNGNYVESDNADPILLYGQQKLDMERHIRTTDRSAAILRLAKVYGETPGDKTLFSSWLPILLRDEVMRAAADQLFSPVFVGDVVDAILTIIERKIHGVYHAAGPVGASRLEFLTMLRSIAAQYLSVRATIAPCSIHDFKLPERRPEDVTMRPDKLIAATGLVLRKPENSCLNLVKSAIKASL